MKPPLTEQRAEMVRHILEAKRIAEDGDEQVLAYLLEQALIEIVGDENAAAKIKRLAVN